MDNLPPPTLIEIEEEILPMAEWSRRKQLVALKYLYTLCRCRIDDISREIGKALAKELDDKKRGFI